MSSVVDEIRKEYLTQDICNKVIQGHGHCIFPWTLRSYSNTIFHLLPRWICNTPLQIQTDEYLVKIQFLHASIQPPVVRREDGSWSFLTEWESITRKLSWMNEVKTLCVMHVFGKTKPEHPARFSFWSEGPVASSHLPVYPHKQTPVSSSVSTEKGPPKDMIYSTTYMDAHLTDEEQKNYPYLHQEDVCSNALFCAVPCQKGGLTSDTWDDFNLQDHCRYDSLPSFVLKGSRRFMVSEDGIRPNVCLIRWNTNKQLLGEIYSFDSLKCILEEGLFHVVLAGSSFSLSLLVRALGEEGIPEQRFASRVYHQLLLRCGTSVDAKQEWKQNEDSLKHYWSIRFSHQSQDEKKRKKLGIRDMMVLFWYGFCPPETPAMKHGSSCLCHYDPSQSPTTLEEAYLTMYLTKHNKRFVTSSHMRQQHDPHHPCPIYLAHQAQITQGQAMVEKDVFPHISTSACSDRDLAVQKEQKLHYLAQLITDMWMVYGGHAPVTHTGYMKYKRICTPGRTISRYLKKTIKHQYRKIQQQIQTSLRRAIPFQLFDVLKQDTVTSSLHAAFVLGQFSASTLDHSGHTQLHQRNSPLSAMSQMTRLIARPFHSPEPRSLLDSLGSIDMHCTPDSDSCGEVTYTTLNFLCSEESDDSFLLEWIRRNGQLQPLEIEDWALHAQDFIHATRNNYRSVHLDALHQCYSVVFNGGRPLGWTRKPKRLLRQLRGLRRTGLIPSSVSVSICFSTRILSIDTDAGRPLLEVLNVRQFLYLNRVYGVETLLQMTDQDMRRVQMLETVDHVEIGIIATTIDECIDRIKQGEATLRYCFFHRSVVQSIAAALQPCAAHNMATRIGTSANMSSQASSIGSFQFRHTAETTQTIFVLQSPQRPLVSTGALQWFHLYDTPLGINVPSAVISFQGSTQDDCILMNLHSLQLGAYASIACRTAVCQENVTRLYDASFDQYFYPEHTERFLNASLTSSHVSLSTSSFAAIEENGLPRPGCLVSAHDSVLFSKVRPISSSVYSDRSELGTERLSGRVDSTWLTLDAQKQRMVNTFVTLYKEAKQGDKFTSRHGQKGLQKQPIPRHLLPHNAEGLVPTYNINHAAFHSRMTIGQLVEMILSQLMEATGEPMDGTLFSSLYKQADEHRRKYTQSSLLYEDQALFGVEDMDTDLFPIEMDDTEKEKKVRLVCRKIFKRLGYSVDGLSPMYSGITGKRLAGTQGDGLINFNMVYTLSLHHRVDYKIKAAGNDTLGVRIGEMERDLLISHGVSGFAQDRLHPASDLFFNSTCSKCGQDAVTNEKDQFCYCAQCGPGIHVKKVKMSHGLKQLFNTVRMFNITPFIRLEPL